MSKKGVRPPSIEYFVFFPKSDDPNVRPILEEVPQAKYTERRNRKRLTQQVPSYNLPIFFPPVMLPAQPQLPSPPPAPNFAVPSENEQEFITVVGGGDDISFPSFIEDQEEDMSLFEQDHIGECGIFADDF